MRQHSESIPVNLKAVALIALGGLIAAVGVTGPLATSASAGEWSVSNEAEWRAAIAAAMIDGSSPVHTITVTADIEFDDTTTGDVYYNGSSDLIIEGGGFIFSETATNTAIPLVVDSLTEFVSIENLILDGFTGEEALVIEANSGVELHDVTVRNSEFSSQGVRISALDALLQGVHVEYNAITSDLDDGVIDIVAQDTYVVDSWFVGNSVAGKGGALAASGYLSVADSFFADNSASLDGGALYAGSFLDVFDTTFFGNHAGRDGGAIWADADVWLRGVTAVANSAGGEGGVAWSYVGIEVDDSVLEDNHADEHGGVLFGYNDYVDIENSVVRNNSAGGSGGVASARNSVDVYTSQVTGNSAGFRGGAIDSVEGDSYLRDSEFADNTAEADGGAVSAFNGVEIEDSTFTGNMGEMGGAVYVYDGGLDIFTSTFVDNSATDQGGAIYTLYGNVAMVTSTLSANQAVNGGAHVYVGDLDLQVEGSVFAGAVGSDGCEVLGLRLDQGATFDTDGTCSTSTSDGFGLGADPMLGTLRANGASTRTLLPQPGSPLIDYVDPASCTHWEEDQRGVERPRGDGCDVGAVEVIPDPFPDVPSTHPFALEIDWLASEEISGGYGDGTFRPTAGVSRQAMAAFLYRYAAPGLVAIPTEPTFDDVPTTHPFFAEIEWLAGEGIAGGYADGTFRPTATVSRQAMAAFLVRVSEGDAEIEGPAEPSFSDVPTDHPFYGEIEWLVDQGVVGGYSDGTFRGGAPVSRQAMAAFLYRFDQEVWGIF